MTDHRTFGERVNELERRVDELETSVAALEEKARPIITRINDLEATA